MKKLLWVLPFFILFLGVRGAWGMGSASDSRKPIREAFAPREVLVQFWATVTPQQIDQLLRRIDAGVKEKIDPPGIYVITFAQSTSPESMAARLRGFREVAHAEPNALVELFWWDVLLPGEAFAEETRATLGAGAKVTVAVIDTAIDANHPALAGKIVQGYNVLNGTTNTQSTGVGQDWHGTASTGRILDGAGDANVQIMPIQVFGTSGGTSWSNVIKAINYAVDNGAQVINMSLGGYSNSPLVQQAIDRAVEKGIVVVASSGNNNTSQPAYPASFKGVISVAATNEGGKKASFSNYGTAVDISAPGDTQRLLSHGGYRMARGTSFSAPFIAGMAALLKSAFPSLRPNQCEEVLKAKASPLPGKGSGMGAGFLNSADVRKWMGEIRAGTFTFPWSRQPVPPVVRPSPPAVAPAQPWLVRGQVHDGEWVVSPSGELIKEEKSK